MLECAERLLVLQGLRVAWKKVGPYNYKCRAAAPQLAGASFIRGWHADLLFTCAACARGSHAVMASDVLWIPWP